MTVSVLNVTNPGRELAAIMGSHHHGNRFFFLAVSLLVTLHTFLLFCAQCGHTQLLPIAFLPRPHSTSCSYHWHGKRAIVCPHTPSSFLSPLHPLCHSHEKIPGSLPTSTISMFWGRGWVGGRGVGTGERKGVILLYHIPVPNICSCYK